MNQSAPNLEQYSPHSLLGGFTRSRFWLWLVAATLIHLLAISLLSLSYIRDNYIDPEGAAARKAAAAAVAQAEAEKNKPKPPPVAATPATNATAAVANTNAVPATFSPVSNALSNIPEDRRNTEVVRQITEAASSNEIPRVPDSLGISIRDTQIR